MPEEKTFIQAHEPKEAKNGDHWIDTSLSQDDALDLLWGGKVENWKLVDDILIDTGRWNEHRAMILLDTISSRLYKVNYERGLTEMQHCEPFEWTPFKLIPVDAVEKIVTVVEYVEFD